MLKTGTISLENMDVFKRLPYKKESILISEENFSRYTQKAEPYYSIINGHEKYFAVCPICDNPIQIIGLYKHEEGERRKPFGKHYKGNIAELANYDEEAYRRCPYHNPDYQGKRIRRSKGNDTSNALYQYLIKNFDEIIQSLEKKIHIKISYTFANILKEYFLVNKGWEYYDCTYNNLPFMLLYAQPSYTLVKRRIKVNTKLCRILRKIHNIKLVETDDKEYLKIVPEDGKFVKLLFMICNHKKKLIKEKLVETFRLSIHNGEHEIYSETIKV